MFGSQFLHKDLRQKKDSFEHVSSVLILEVKDTLAIQIEKKMVDLPILYGSCGVIGQSHASLYTGRKGEKTNLNAFILVPKVFSPHKHFP